MAFQGIDFRDLWRPGSGLTLRRLWVLLHALPYGSPLHVSVQAAMEEAAKAKPGEIRERQAAFERRNAARLAKEMADEH